MRQCCLILLLRDPILNYLINFALLFSIPQVIFSAVFLAFPFLLGNAMSQIYYPHKTPKMYKLSSKLL